MATTASEQEGRAPQPPSRSSKLPEIDAFIEAEFGSIAMLSHTVPAYDNDEAYSDYTTMDNKAPIPLYDKNETTDDTKTDSNGTAPRKTRAPSKCLTLSAVIALIAAFAVQVLAPAAIRVVTNKAVLVLLAAAGMCSHLLCSHHIYSHLMFSHPVCSHLVCSHHVFTYIMCSHPVYSHHECSH